MKPLKRPVRPLSDLDADTAAKGAGELLGVALTAEQVGTLSPEDQQELWALVIEGHRPHFPPSVLEDQRRQKSKEKADAARFVELFEEKALGYVSESANGWEQTDFRLLAEQARRTGRVPTRAQIEAISANRDATATLAELAIPERPPERELKGYAKPLSAKKRRRLEALVGEAAFADPEHFEKQREEAQTMKKIRDLAAGFKAAPETKLARIPEGSVVLTPEMFKGIEQRPLAMRLGRLAVLALVLRGFVAEKPPLERWRLEGDTLIVSGSIYWTEVDPECEVHVVDALRQLAKLQWLEFEEGRGDPRTREHRVRLGPRMKETLAKLERSERRSS
jgi:hypothetical protein